MLTSARPPIAAACGPAIGRSPSFPRRSGGCAGCIRLRSPPLPPLGCRTPYPGACAAAHPLSVRAARPRYSRSSLPGASVPARSPRRSPPPAVHRRHRSPGSFWCPFFPGRWDSCPSFSPPKRALPSIASADCHCHCTPPSSSHSATRTAQIRSKIPAAAQRWNQSWTVLLGPYRSGSWSHWQPLRIRKMIALSIFRQLATFRPVGFLGQNSNLRPPGPACDRSETVVGGEGQEPRVVNRHVVLVAGHHDFHIIIQAGCGYTAQMGEGAHVLVQGSRHVLGLDESQILASRVAQDITEQRDAAA